MKRWMISMLLGSMFWVFGSGNASAQWAVVDVSAVPQWIKQLEDNIRELEALNRQLDQAKATYSLFKGSRNFGDFLMTAIDRRAYDFLPPEQVKALDDVRNLNFKYQALAARIERLRRNTTLLNEGSFNNRMTGAKNMWRDSVSAISMTAAVGQVAYEQAGQRVERINTMTTRINTTDDPKSIAELQARMTAEGLQLQNEHNRLVAVQISASADERALRQQQSDRMFLIGSKPIPKVEFPQLGGPQ